MFEFRRIRTCYLMEDEQLPVFSSLLCQTSWGVGGGGSYKMMKWDVQQTLMQGIRRCISSINWPNRGQGPHCHPQWLHTLASSNTNHIYTQQKNNSAWEFLPRSYTTEKQQVALLLPVHLRFVVFGQFLSSNETSIGNRMTCHPRW